MESKKFRLNLGDHVKDLVTSYEGIVAARADHITGCDTYIVLPRDLDSNTGDIIDGRWFDDGRLELIKSKVVELKEVKSESGNGAINLDIKKA